MVRGKKSFFKLENIRCLLFHSLTGVESPWLVPLARGRDTDSHPQVVQDWLAEDTPTARASAGAG